VPNLSALRSRGVRAQSMQPVFASKTFTNHWYAQACVSEVHVAFVSCGVLRRTLVTGLYAETHGIVSNTIYDPVFNATFTMSNQQPLEGRWWGGEPIWNTAQRAGLKTFVMFWPVRAQ
jgi:predicted AlkP superfamily pyrophosphatase or phosphodiesterase